VDSKKANKRVLEALIRSGAMDDFAAVDGAGVAEDIDSVRSRLLAELADAMQGAEQVAQNAAAGIADMFGGLTEQTSSRPRAYTALEKRDRLEFEKESLGLYLTGHPIEEYLDEIRQFCTASLGRIRAEKRKQYVAGLVVSQRTMKSRRGGSMAFLVIDDRSARLDAMLLPDCYEAAQQKISKDAVLVLEGEVQEDDYTGALKIQVDAVLTIEEARRRFSRGVQIDLGCSSMDRDLISRLRTSLEPHRQSEAGCPVAVVCTSERGDGLAAQGKVLRREFGTDQVSLSYPGAQAG
jgi:DNA polymerase-3 subunit alpha